MIGLRMQEQENQRRAAQQANELQLANRRMQMEQERINLAKQEQQRDKVLTKIQLFKGLVDANATDESLNRAWASDPDLSSMNPNPQFKKVSNRFLRMGDSIIDVEEYDNLLNTQGPEVAIKNSIFSAPLSDSELQKLSADVEYKKALTEKAKRGSSQFRFVKAPDGSFVKYNTVTGESEIVSGLEGLPKAAKQYSDAEARTFLKTISEQDVPEEDKATAIREKMDELKERGVYINPQLIEGYRARAMDVSNMIGGFLGTKSSQVEKELLSAINEYEKYNESLRKKQPKIGTATEEQPKAATSVKDLQQMLNEVRRMRESLK
jgi:hypothetical protein